MPGKSTLKVRGSRFTKPQVRVRDTREAEGITAQFMAQMRGASTAGCLELDGLQQRPLPTELQRLDYQCDRPELTHFAGVPAFLQFAYSLGLAERLAQVPLSKRQSVYAPGKLCEVIVALLAAGLERVSHVDDYTTDPGLCAALGLPRLPDQSTLSRMFDDATPETVAAMRRLNQEFAGDSLRHSHCPARVVVDCDTRVVGVYGKQEGAKRTPCNGGSPQFTFEITALRNNHDMLDGGLLPGATHPVPLFEARCDTVLEQLAGTAREVIWCADAAWYAASILQRLEAADADPAVRCVCKYAIRAQGRPRLRAAIGAIPQAQWQPCGEDLEVAEFNFAFKETRQGKDERPRRYVVTRKALADKPVPGGQGSLLPQPRYEYWAIVTNLDWKPAKVWALYNGRTTVESILKESALGFQMDSLPSQRFAGNALFCQLLIASYNHVNLFRRACLPVERARHYVQGLRRKLLAVPGLIDRRASRLVIHCAAQGPHVELLAAVMQRLAELVPPPRAALPAAAAT